MKVYEEKQVTSKQKVLINTICDCCGKNVENDLINFNVNEFNLTYKKGNHYPDYGYGEEANIDFCHSCRDKLFDMLENQMGVNIDWKEYDY